MPPDRVQSKRKPRPSLRAREYHASTRPGVPRTSQGRKRPSQTAEEVDLTADEPETLEAVSKRASKAQESLPTKYTLAIEVFIGKIQIHAQTKLQTAGGFYYSKFIQDEAQRVSNHCLLIGRDIGRRGSMARITYNKKSAFESYIEGPEDWIEFDEFVGSCLKDKGKRDVQVHWKITYELKELSAEPDKETLRPSGSGSGSRESSDIDDDLNDTRKGATKAGGASTKVSRYFKKLYIFISIYTDCL